MLVCLLDDGFLCSCSIEVSGAFFSGFVGLLACMLIQDVLGPLWRCDGLNRFLVVG